MKSGIRRLTLSALALLAAGTTINFDCPPPLKDTDLNAGAPQAACAFDGLQKLGETDLKINHPEVLK